MKRIIIAVIVLLIFPAIIAAQDDAEATPEAEERTVELFSAAESARRFNVPVPDAPGWVNLSAGDVAHFQNSDLNANIYVTALPGTNVEANLTTLLRSLVEGFEAEQPVPFTTADVNLGGTTWRQELYELEDGRDLTVFGGVRGENTYGLIYVNGDPESDYYNLITQQEDEANLEEGVAEALAILDASVDGPPDSVDTVQLSNGEWIRHVYEDANIHLIAQERVGNVTYVAIERGDGHLVEAMNKQFLTVFLGFFLTPNNDEYLVLGLFVTVVLMGGLIASFFWRQRNLQKDIALIQQLREED